MPIDKEGITEGILGGLDKPIGQMLTPAHFGWVEDIPGLPYDPDKAKALVAEVGGSPKVEIADRRRLRPARGAGDPAELADVGFDASIELVDTPTFLKLIQQGAQGGPALGRQPLVLRLPGRRRRAVPAVPFRQSAGRSSRARSSTAAGRRRGQTLDRTSG